MSNVVLNQKKILNSSKYAGFSLIEVFMVLSLMIVVALPTVQALTNIKKDTKKVEATTTASVMYSSLFDVVDPMNYNAVNDYTVDDFTSVYCDPASPTFNSAKCRYNVSSGGWKDKPPFFKRDIIPNIEAFTDMQHPNAVALGVKVLLSNDQYNVSDVSKRIYPIDSYRIYSRKNNDTSSFPVKDFMGETWYPENYNKLNSNTFYATNPEDCGPSVGIGNETPTGDFYKDSSLYYRKGCGLKYSFKVVGGKKYAVRLYLKNDTGSTNVVNVEATESRGSKTLYIKNGIDVDNATKGYVSGAETVMTHSFVVRTPKTAPNITSRTMYLNVVVKATPEVTSSQAYVTGIEVVGI